MRPRPGTGGRTRARRRPDPSGSGGRAGGASKRPKTGGPGCLAAFFSIFLLAGLGFLWLILIGPAIAAWRARSWVATDCVVESSHVETHPGEDSATYSVEISYRYVYGGHEYRSGRYDFFTGSTSGYEGKARVVEQYPPGRLVTCWVDPAEPSEAVIERRLTGQAWFGLLPMVFVVVGGGGMIWSLRSGVRSRRRRREEDGRARRAPVPAGPVSLARGVGPAGRFFGVLAIAAVWNGITGLLVWQAVQTWRAGAPDGCLTVFMIPFVAVGLLLLGAVPYQLLALANPRPHLTLAPAAVPAGGSAELSWVFTRAAHRLRALKVEIERSETTVTRSRNKIETRTRPAFTATVFETDDRARARAGSTRLTVPPDAEPTIDEDDRRVAWKVKVTGTIRYWPDVTQDFAFEVLPPDPEAVPPIPPPPADLPVEESWEPPPAPLPPVEPR